MRKRVFSILIVVTSLLGMCLRVGAVEAETGTEKKEMDKHEQEESGKLSELRISYKTIPGTWIQDSKGWWYRHSDGSYTINNWELIGGQWYYFDGQGYMYTGWLQQGSAWYYLDSSGVMRTGWIQVGSAWYYMNSNGVMQTGWLQQGGKWYYLNSNGVMQTGWLQQGGVWYYLDSNGVMQTGWHKINDIWYYFDSSGAEINAKKKNKEKEIREFFTIPKGGWSSAVVLLSYQECYIDIGNYVHYVEHVESELHKCVGVTTRPVVNLNILQYSDGTQVYPWSVREIMYNPLKWDSGQAFVNYNKYSYRKDTSVKGTVTGVIYCDGATVPYRAISVSQNLNI